ncbi:MAG: hypothetical protein GY833_16555 [Aestuariibacter sp.]|nr:hypothetical protein [Aestuariibacter sp.]
MARRWEAQYKLLLDAWNADEDTLRAQLADMQQRVERLREGVLRDKKDASTDAAGIALKYVLKRFKDEFPPDAPKMEGIRVVPPREAKDICPTLDEIGFERCKPPEPDKSCKTCKYNRIDKSCTGQPCTSDYSGWQPKPEPEAEKSCENCINLRPDDTCPMQSCGVGFEKWQPKPEPEGEKLVAEMMTSGRPKFSEPLTEARVIELIKEYCPTRKETRDEQG